MSEIDTPNVEPATDFPVDKHSCSLLGPTALIVQALMGVLVILSLVYKRHRETTKRPWRIWLFDVSKQVVGQMFVHGVNVFISDIGSHHSAGNACVFYFLNILIDTTLGVALIYLILRVLTYLLANKLKLKGFESGQYGNPPSAKCWLRQAAVYVLSLTSMKLLVVGLFALYPGIFKIGDWLLSWTRTGDEDALQVIVTMGIFPIIMNILQFWLIDSIVKASESPSVALEPDSQNSFEGDRDREPLFGAPSDDEDDDNETTRPQYDIENPRSRSQSRDGTKVSTTPEDHKSVTTTSISGTSTPGKVTEEDASVAMHAYPPSTASTSLTSTSPVSRRNSTSPTSRENKAKRTTPAPLHLQSARHPAQTSRPISIKQADAQTEEMSRSQLSQNTVAATPEQDLNKEWASSWDDSDDWATRVGEDDWTGKRIEHKKGVLSEAWGPGSPQQRQQHVGAVGS